MLKNTEIVTNSMAKAPIKLEGYIGSMKVCSDQILGGNTKNPAFSDVYSNMIYVPIEGLRDTKLVEKKEDEDFAELICPLTEFKLEQQTIDKKYSS